MNQITLKQLYEMQKVLDERIIKEKGLEGQDLLPKKILALQVELGECANEWRGFKFWSNDQQPRTLKVHSDRDAYLETNPLLEEYIDCLHFTLSIGIDIGFNIAKLETVILKLPNILDQFMWINKRLCDLYEDHRDKDGSLLRHYYYHLINSILGLGEMLGFTWDQITAAYMDKNKVNHERQATGY